MTAVPVPACRNTAWSARLPLGIGWAAVAVLVAGFGGWAGLTTIAGAIVAPGQLEVDQNRQAVQHPVGGVVGRLLVAEGDRVEAGQVLIRLDDTELRSKLAVIEGQYFDLVARRGRLGAERDGASTISFDAGLIAAAAVRPDLANLIDGQVRLFEARRRTMATEIELIRERQDQIRAQVDGLAVQGVALERQADLIALELTDQQTLFDKGLAQVGRVLALKREAVRLEGLIGEIASAKAEAAGRDIEASLTLARLDAARREAAITQLREVQFRENELAEQRRLTLSMLARLDIRAPSSGVVFGLAVNSVGAVVQAADPVLFIVPTDRPLVIAARVPPIHIDEVRVGQKVTLRFPAFGDRTTPELEGQVAKVSADALSDRVTGASFYRVEVLPDEGELAKLGDLTLLPGMPVEGYIRTTDRTPIAYLVKPLADYFNRAFREE